LTNTHKCKNTGTCLCCVSHRLFMTHKQIYMVVYIRTRSCITHAYKTCLTIHKFICIVKGYRETV
uniref:Uncharacterized protein n=1 Tax=Panagrolaimus sp. JU765 TaxID=591449 RepID=A0AC34QA19_9BILA